MLAISDHIHDDTHLPLPVVGVCEMSLDLPAARVQLRRFDWCHQREGGFVPQSTYIELTRIRARGGHSPLPRDWHSLGPVRMFLGGRPFFSRWYEAIQKSLYCALDIEALTGVSLHVEEHRLSEACNLKNSYLQHLLMRIEREVREPGFASALVIDSALRAVAAELLQHFTMSGHRARGRGDRFSPADVARLAARLREGDWPGSIEALAQEERLSTRQFSRLFRAAAGESVGVFCGRNMAERGRDLLHDRTLLVKEVAVACGFSSTTTFSRAFRRAHGMNPMDYRRRIGVFVD